MPVDIYPKGIEKYIHTLESCDGLPCPIHAPSEHRMNEWPIYIRTSALTERLCEHSVGHPDPDSVAWMTRMDPANGPSYAIHGCDSCCFGGS
jgi:hypothetical protein